MVEEVLQEELEECPFILLRQRQNVVNDVSSSVIPITLVKGRNDVSLAEFQSLP